MRAAQHFDALHVREIVESPGRAGAEHAVDKDADRWFDAEIVVAIAEAADREGRVGRALQLLDAERRRHGLKVDQVSDLCTLERFGAGHRHGNRGFLKGLFALSGGNDDGVAAADVGGVFVPVVVAVGLILNRGRGHIGLRMKRGRREGGGRKQQNACSGGVKTHQNSSLISRHPGSRPKCPSATHIGHPDPAQRLPSFDLIVHCERDIRVTQTL